MLLLTQNGGSKTLDEIPRTSKLKETKPDYIIIFPWNIKEEIIEQLQYVKEWGTKFVIPIPELNVIN